MLVALARSQNRATTDPTTVVGPGEFFPQLAFSYDAVQVVGRSLAQYIKINESCIVNVRSGTLATVLAASRLRAH